MKSNIVLDCIKFCDDESKLRLFRHVERLEGSGGRRMREAVDGWMTGVEGGG